MTRAAVRIAIAAVLAAAPSVAAAQTGITREQVERRYNVRMFENVLVTAAQHGAELLGLRVSQIDPGIILLTGTAPRAQGFVIEGYGVFFAVDIPAVDPVVAWAVRTRGRDEMADRSITALRQLVRSVADPQQRAIYEQQLRRIEQRLTPPGGGMQQTSDASAAQPALRPPLMDDPNLEYERMVTEQLIDAMLDHSHLLGLGDDDWLQIAARGSHGPLLAQAAFDDSVTLMLRVKASDLADFRAGRITRDQARERVTVREF